MHPLRHIFLAMLLTVTPATLAAETGTALKADSLRAKPFADAAVSGKLSRGDKVDILAKQGVWLNIRAAGKSGWVRLLTVKRGASNTSGNNVSGVLSMASGRAGTGQVVATTGVRGLNAEELKSAKFDEAEVKRLEGYTQSAAQGKQFAASAGLKAVKFAYLPASPTQPSQAETAGDAQ